MTLLILGLILWTFPHLIKELAPGLRAGLPEKSARGIIALLTFVSLALMVIGYRGAEFVAVYDPPSWGIHLNNLLMVISVLLFGAANSKSRLRGMIRHPMLTGSLLWGIAHLLANGDRASVVLFVGIAVWSVLGMVLTNRRVHDYVPYAQGSAKGDIRLAVITVVVFGVIVAIHTWLGYRPFPG